MEYKYQAVRIVQQVDAPTMYLLSVPAAQLLEWADVPRKKADFMAGYQRPLNEGRSDKVTEFIEKSPDNIIPGAIIVAVRDDNCAVSLGASGDVCEVTISMDEIPLSELIRETAQQFMARLSDDEKASIGRHDDAPEQQPDEDDTPSEEIPPDSYMASLTSELLAASKNINDLSEDRRAAITDYVESISKPGRILDGQHRVWGAKNVESQDIMMPIVLIPGLRESEQVFHFYVLNNKPAALKPTELRGTVSTSLTNREIEDLYLRFKQAGVLAEEARWTHRMNNDPDSPFCGLIDFGFGSGFIRENVAHQLVTSFVKLGRKYKMLYSSVDNWTNDHDYAYRMRVFYTVWASIRDVYPNAWSTAIANEGGQIFMKASMLVLQQLVLDALNLEMPRRASKGEPSPLEDMDELALSVKSALHFLPEDFFTRTWQEKGLDTSAGRQFLREQMDLAIQRMGEKIGHLTLLRAK